ncbi:uncharacterized protein LOC109946889 isoform X3 [Prunus persica]|uniref:uncharacterized protein LOC109946889 isoform X3 n=1 Tax=Prunus persica TaxID=3760 RepID=UPI0009AB6D44|nr:uncharacterized protein LOC109946889 isoform X3 [Prunus persica]
MAEQVNHNSIETLIGSNYTKWREDVEIALGLLDYEMVIEEEAPAEPAATASAEAKAKYAKWIKANKMAILIMRRSISPSVRGSITPSDNAKKFIDSIAEKFQESKKAEIGTLMAQLTDAKYNGEKCVRTHILNMLEIGNKLQALKVNVDENMMEEQNMKKDKAEERVNMVHNFKPKKDFGKGKIAWKKNKEEKGSKGLEPEGFKCYFCKNLVI